MGIPDFRFPIPDSADDYVNDGVNGRAGGMEARAPGAGRASEAAMFHHCLMANRVHLVSRVGCADTLALAMHWLSTVRGSSACGPSTAAL